MADLYRPEEWHYQWSEFRNDDDEMFAEWLKPFSLSDFKDKNVLEAGCGGGHHTAMMAQHARSVTAVDANTAEIARERCSGYSNVSFVEADLMSLDLGKTFDVVVCIGVIHHTDDPDVVFENLYRHCVPGGAVVIWTYSSEGNELVRFCLEPIRRLILSRLPRRLLISIAWVTTLLLYPVVHTIYRLPFLSFLPYYQYFVTFRRLSFARNLLNVFDKMNAPQTKFTTYDKCLEWFSSGRFVSDSISIRLNDGVGWSLMGVRRA